MVRKSQQVFKKGIIAFLFVVFISACQSSPGNEEDITQLVPENFNATAYNGRILLTWNAVKENEVEGYEINYGTSANNLDQNVDVNNSLILSYSFNNLEDQDYYFKIRTKLSIEEESVFSQLVSAKPVFNNNTSVDTFSVDVATWNIEWFYDSQNGPSDDDKQYDRVKNLIDFFKFDILAVQEIASPSQYSVLTSELNDYSSRLSNYSWDQKTGVIYRDTVFSLISVSPITQFTSYADAGRDPLLVHFKHIRTNVEVKLIIIHAKAQSGSSNHDRRKALSEDLKDYIETSLSNDNVILLGDYNDKLTGAITSGLDSPYKNFSDDSNYSLVTQIFNNGTATEFSYPSFGNTIDHIIINNSMSVYLNQGSQNILYNEAKAVYSDFSSTISDHYPVMTSFKFWK